MKLVNWASRTVPGTSFRSGCPMTRLYGNSNARGKMRDLVPSERARCGCRAGSIVLNPRSRIVLWLRELRFIPSALWRKGCVFYKVSASASDAKPRTEAPVQLGYRMLGEVFLLIQHGVSDGGAFNSGRPRKWIRDYNIGKCENDRGMYFRLRL